MDTEACATALRAALSKRRDVRLAYLFGSSAAGSAAPQDVDVAVLLDAPEAGQTPLRRELELLAELEEAVPGVPVDLLLLDEAPLALQFEVLKGGRPLLARSEDERVDFEARVMAQMHDRLPYERLRDSWLLERIRERGLA